MGCLAYMYLVSWLISSSFTQQVHINYFLYAASTYKLSSQNFCFGLKWDFQRKWHAILKSTFYIACIIKGTTCIGALNVYSVIISL